jgi:hypothetical protein
MSEGISLIENYHLLEICGPAGFKTVISKDSISFLASYVGLMFAFAICH